jgi:hypothetical protein
MKASKDPGGGAPTGKEYGKLLEESLVLLSTNPVTADTLRPFKYVESCRIVKRSLLSTEEACDILVDIHDHQCLITVGAKTLEDKLKRSSHNVSK